MEVSHTTFEEKDIAKHGTSAGVVPIAKNARGDLVLLLGRERFSTRWRGSCKWSGFEGGRDEGESLDETCRREFMEETLGVVGCVGPRIEGGGHWRRIVTRVYDEADEHKVHRYHQTLVLPIAYDDRIPSRFAERRESIDYIEYCVRLWRHTIPATISMHGDIGDATDQSAEHITLQVDGVDGHAETVTVHGACKVQEIKEWFVCRERLERSLIDHPSVTVARTPMGKIGDVIVHREHLEKDQVRWWTVSELERVLENFGSFHQERFRPYFLPVLQVILRTLASSPPSDSELGAGVPSAAEAPHGGLSPTARGP